MITNSRTPWDPRAPPWRSGMTPRTSRTKVTEITTSNSSKDECYQTVMFGEQLILLSGACCQTFLNLMQSRKVLQQYQQIISQKLFQIIKQLLFFLNQLTLRFFIPYYVFIGCFVNIQLMFDSGALDHIRCDCGVSSGNVLSIKMQILLVDSLLEAIFQHMPPKIKPKPGFFLDANKIYKTYLSPRLIPQLGNFTFEMSQT